MTSEWPYARLAANLLRRKPVEVRPRPFDRDVAIVGIAQAIAEQQRRMRRHRRLVRGAWVGVAAAAVVGLGSTGLRQLSGTQRASSAQCPSAAPCAKDASTQGAVGRLRGIAFAPGQSASSGPGQNSVIRFASGTKVTVRENSKVNYRSNRSTQRFRLAHGALHLDVAKLGSKRRLVVETQDAEVEVHGTVFDVSVVPETMPCAPTRTRVSVEEGVVEVRAWGRSHRVGAGATWPAECSRQKPAPTQPTRIARDEGGGVPAGVVGAGPPGAAGRRR